MNDQMNQAQINATLAAVGEQRNAAMNQSALLSGQLAIALQDIEGLNKIVADNQVSTAEYAKEADKQAARIDELVDYKRNLEEMRVTPIDSPELAELRKKNKALEEFHVNQAKTIRDRNGAISKLESGLEESEHTIRAQSNFLNDYAAETKNLRKTIIKKDSVISGLEAQLKDLRGDHLPKGATYPDHPDYLL